MTEVKTLHIIFNAHIDPIWLWPWQSGLDECLATCRSACDRLDRHPDLTFSRGEAWVYQQVERLDPELFARIGKHIDDGRWEIVGGWWIQPDCNQPSGFALERQISVGKDYFQSRFNRFPRIAYNVDTFGHTAALPQIMRDAGQDRYVMMRPEQHEMALPSNLFRWRGYEGGPEVVTYRIHGGYTNAPHDNPDRIQRVADTIDPRIGHGMLFTGLGDHGGGPTETAIAWYREHWNDFPGIRLEFSTPSRFFDAIWAKREVLPTVTGELQQHAIGCYSVHRPIKTSLRHAEHLLAQAELTLHREQEILPKESAALIDESWKKIAFNQFHDTLGGTCLPSAYAQPIAQLGFASCVADDLLQNALRLKMRSLPEDTHQRIVLYNASDRVFDGPVQYSPWMDWKRWQPGWHLLDENGNRMALQTIESEAVIDTSPQLLFWAKIGAGKMHVLRIVESDDVPSSPEAADRLVFPGDGIVLPGGLRLEAPVLELINDPSDTWSHGLDRYRGEIEATAAWSEPIHVDRGPLMASWTRQGRIGESELTAEWRTYMDHFVELKLVVAWGEHQKLLKLALPFPAGVTRRTDGIVAGWLPRPLDGRELPVRDGAIFDGPAGKLGIVCPDVYAADATPEQVRFTLLRSSVLAHHDPHGAEAARRTFSDCGEHMFTFRFFGGGSVTSDLIDDHAYQIHRPPIAGDLTRGMSFRWGERA